MNSRFQARRIAVIFLVTLAGALWLYLKGPIPVIRGTTALDEIVPFWYMVSAFPVLGILVVDFLSALGKYRFGRRTILLFSQILVLMMISNIRLSLKIPISGHAFLFSFFIFYRIFGKDIKSTLQKAELRSLARRLLTLQHRAYLATNADILT
jgi:hypothetical protein